MRTKTVVALLSLGLAAAASAQQKGAVLRDVSVVQVESTVIADPEKVKDEAAAGLVQDSLKNALQRLNVEVGEAPITARIILEEFTGGSAMKRFMVGFGAGRSTVEGRLVFRDGDGKELANVKLRVRGSVLFSSYQDNSTQQRQASAAFDDKLVEEISRLRGLTGPPPAAAAAKPAAAKPSTNVAPSSATAAPTPAAPAPAPTPAPAAAPASPAATTAAPSKPAAAPASAPAASSAPPAATSAAPATAPAASSASPAAAPGPAVEGLSPQQVSELLGKPQYVLEGRDGVTTWFFEVDGKSVLVYFLESKASLKRQR